MAQPPKPNTSAIAAATAANGTHRSAPRRARRCARSATPCAGAGAGWGMAGGWAKGGWAKGGWAIGIGAVGIEDA
jgi:hypothetical protein